jgi:hypothetical protein
MPDQVHWKDLHISLAKPVDPPRASVPPNPFVNWPNALVAFQDSTVVARDARAHYQFVLDDQPADWKSAKVVDMAFRQTAPDEQAEWTCVTNSDPAHEHSKPFWIVRDASADAHGIGLNDVPITHPNHPIVQVYDLLLVIAYVDQDDNEHVVLCDPEIHNQQAV